MAIYADAIVISAVTRLDWDQNSVFVEFTNSEPDSVTFVFLDGQHYRTIQEEEIVIGLPDTNDHLIELVAADSDEAVADVAAYTEGYWLPGNKVKLTWSHATPATVATWKVYRGTANPNATPPTLVKSGLTVQEYVSPKLTDGTWWYEVRAVDSVGNITDSPYVRRVVIRSLPSAVLTFTLTSFNNATQKAIFGWTA